MKARKFISFMMGAALVASFASCSEDETFVPVHKVTTTDTVIGTEACTFNVIINCNVECIETSEADFLSVECTEGNGICTLTISATENNSYESRVGKIKVEFKDNQGVLIPTATQYITITQNGAEAPTFTLNGEAEVTATYEEALVTFEWTTNCTLGEAAIDADWVTLDRMNETGARFVVSAFSLVCDSTRTATITIPYTTEIGEVLEQVLTITQSAKDTFTPSDITGNWTQMLSGNGSVYQKGVYTFNADGTYHAETQTYVKETDEPLIDEATGLPAEPTVIDGAFTTSEVVEGDVAEALFHLSTGGQEDWVVTYNMATLEMTWTYTIKMNFGGQETVLGQVSQVFTKIIE